MQGVEIITFGCRLNAAESAAIGRIGREAGLTETVVVNTCAVTAEAERQARQAVRRARRERPDARIIVTGCAATIAPERYRAMPEVDLVLDNVAKLQPESYGPGSGRPSTLGRDETRASARAYLQVQQGCDHRCTFCIIPYGRGPSRSVPIGALVERARNLIATGCREIVLTGIDLTAYGGDLPGKPRLGDMARRLLAAIPELPRLRLSSLDPAEIDDALWRLFADEPRLMPHLHLSLQAGDDLILKRMKRRHLRADAIATAERARSLRPGVALGADLIAGFPTETEEMFRRTVDLVADCGLSFLHVFPYSPRSGTPAARMPQLPASVIRDRAARLRRTADAALAVALQARVGSTGNVLIERPGVGRTECYASVSVDESEPEGEIRRMRFVGVDGKRLVGVAAG
ncbi:MAG: tRNA (N(6)-L-threonylcarbamoyladenosine(37)-C(2))-methylthiotransferase MtaB [Alphaproteobacteria bacterium]|nr:tRNA (N(6)-L-threonylcarbamoyladenosine(37)-C(2))-methylthiotransferase MtaB [Alphaproteobacteria bacterium]